MEIKEKAQSAFKTGMDTGAPQASKLIISQKLNDVNGNVSKIVDGNGEPKTVFHGTDAKFETFDLSKARQNADIPALFFTNDHDEAAGYGKAGSYFLNLRNPKTGKPAANMQGSQIRQELIEQGFDGTVTVDDEYTEYAAFFPNQIKSATDNAGTFDPKNPSTLFQAEDVEEIQKDLTVTDESLTREQAYKFLETIAHTDLPNIETGITAQINTEQRNKLVSDVAIGKSIENGFTKEQHYAAVSKVDKAWKHAVKIEDRADNGGDANIKSIKRFVAPLRFNSETAYANILVKESVEHGHRVYTVELQEINRLRSILGTLENERTPFRSPIYEKIAQLAYKVNPTGVCHLPMAYHR